MTKLKLFQYGEYCGTNTPPNIITNDDVTITFTTDGSVIRQGFRIYWEIHDGNKEFILKYFNVIDMQVSNKYFNLVLTY